MSAPVWFEQLPIDGYHRFYHDLEPHIRWSDEASALPEDSFAVLEKLCVEIDQGRCADCGSGIGMLLAGDSDQFTEWRTVILIGDPVRAVCEDCAPEDPAPAL